MKYLSKVMAAVGLLLISQFAHASEITDTYTTGDTLTSGTLANIKNAVNDNNTRLSALEATYAIGDVGPGGGWVFYVEVDGRHGLEAAPTDQHGFLKWRNSVDTDTGARGNGIGAGEMNTTLIIVSQGGDLNTYAAGICANLVVTNTSAVEYGDWYLPSIFEVDLMKQNIGTGTAFGPATGVLSTQYWSSTEINLTDALYSGISAPNPFSPKLNNKGVRAVRTF